MKSYIRLLLGIVLICCVGEPAFTQSAGDSIMTAKKLREIVYHLAADSLQGRLAGSIGGDSAASYIAHRMKIVGLQPLKGLSGYLYDFGEEFRSVRNVVGVLPGTSQRSETVILSAHYDHLGTTEHWKPKALRDGIFNGANDDASGVAVMLLLAEYFGRQPHQRTIIFIAFSGEEEGMWGSRAFCSAIKRPDKIVAQINLEMLGRANKSKQPFITSHWHSNVRDLLNKALQDSLHLPAYFGKDETGERHMFLRSDNFPLARLGIPAHTIMLTTDADPYYHTVKDEASTLDYDNMSNISHSIAVAISPLVQGLFTPDRINVNDLPAAFY